MNTLLDKFSCYENHEHMMRPQWLHLQDTIASLHPLIVAFENNPKDLFIILEQLAEIQQSYRGYKLSVPHSYKAKVNSDG